LINLLPPIRDFVESIEDRATDMIRTPKTPKRPPIRPKLETYDEDDDDDAPSTEDQLLASRRHQYYLKYGSGPSLYKLGSLRAGPSLSYSERNNHQRSPKTKRPQLDRKTLSKLYRSDSHINSTTTNSHSIPVGGGGGVGTTVLSAGGQPVTMASAFSRNPVTFLPPQHHYRSTDL
jgi:hypothetical protein